MGRKIVKVYLPTKLNTALIKITHDFGTSDSETLRTAFVEYAFKKGYVKQGEINKQEIED